MIISLRSTNEFRQRLSEKINLIFDFLLPRLCLSCKKNLSVKEIVLCDKCFSELETPESGFIKEEYERKFSSVKLIDDFKAGFLFQPDKPIQHLIHSLKYDKKFLSGIYLGQLITRIFYKEIKAWDADIIIPVPLHKLKKLDRGYNQSEFIAKGISKALLIPVKPKLIKRVRHTETQTHLNHLERIENVRNAFKVKNKKFLEGKRVILVDDVVTTGSTVNECAKVIKDAGSEKIYALFAAIASH